jgi:cytoskeletal protein RodZ
MNFGTHLREAREKRGVSLRQIATSTRISLRTLEALENNEIKKLPGGIFSRAFVRSYAQEIGLDPDEAVREFVHQFPLEHVTAGTKSANDHVVATGEEGVRRRQQQFSLAVTLAILIPIAALVVYFVISSRRSSASEASLEAASANRATTAADTSAASTDSSLPTAQPSPSSTAASALSPAAAAAATRSAAAPGALAIAPNEPLRLKIEPSGPCWVRVTVDGEVRHQALMQKGQVYEGQAKDGFDILIGDAATFRYSINDRPGRTVGESGDVIVARINRATLPTWLAPAR